MFTEAIKAQMKNKGVSIPELARLTGYSPYYISALLRGRKRWNADTLAKVCQVLSLEVSVKPTGTDGPSMPA